jgi:hypothetical protein
MILSVLEFSRGTVDGRLAARARRILKQTFHTKFDKATAPEGRHARRHMHPFRDLLILQPFCGQQDNAATLGHTKRRGSPPNEFLQLDTRC